MDRLLVMRALGGAITGPCSTTREAGASQYNPWIAPICCFRDGQALNGHNVGILCETARNFGFHFCIVLACAVATNAEFFASRVVKKSPYPGVLERRSSHLAGCEFMFSSSIVFFCSTSFILCIHCW